MTLDEIKALYAARDEAAGLLAHAEGRLDIVRGDVLSLAEKIRPTEGMEEWARKVEFSAEKEVFVCWVRSYEGDGVWTIGWYGEPEDQFDEEEPNDEATAEEWDYEMTATEWDRLLRQTLLPARVLIPARWLAQPLDEVLAEHAQRQEQRRARHRDLKERYMAGQRKMKEDEERLLLQQLLDKYAGK